MKKVGIITFHRAVNYGACLQAYALKETLKEIGADAELIDYRSEDVEDIYFKIIRKNISIKTLVKNIITWPVQKRRNSMFSSFLERYLLQNTPCSIHTTEELKNVADKYDLFISGSDQVWSPLCAANDKTYMLDFVSDSQKKYSYAASFGVVDDKYLSDEKIKQLLDSYAFLSVREQKGIEIIHQMLGKESDKKLAQHVDPTFLLPKEKWLALTKPVEKEKYLFIYSLSMPKEIIDYAEELAEQMGLTIKCFTLNNVYSMMNPKRVINGSPIDFLSYIAGAEYVVTNSFHGTAFSIIFNKNFSVVKNVNPQHDNSRLTNILRMLGLEKRLSGVDTTAEVIEPIDYDQVNERVKKMQCESREYLRRIAE